MSQSDVETKALSDLAHRVGEMCERPPHCVTVCATVTRSGDVRVSLEVAMGGPGRPAQARGEGDTVAQAIETLMADVQRRRGQRRRPARGSTPVPALAELDAIPSPLRDAFIQATMAGAIERLAELRGDALHDYARVQSREWRVSVARIVGLAGWLSTETDE